jgi:fructose-bisphosphate aldolase, class I
MASQSLEQVARALVAPGKGILAADESFGTIEKRFKGIDVPSTEENRCAYRELLFTAPGVEEHISGVILFDETMRQSGQDGQPLPDLLEERGIFPGIKVDKGAKPLAAAPGEKVTEGLDGLRKRLEEYRSLGARFAKWRAVIGISDEHPSDHCLRVNAHALARYAALCIEQGLVPIVEPEVLMDGSHGLDRCFEVTERTLHVVFDELHHQRVPLRQMLLKPNMVVSGSECPNPASVEEVAEATVRCFENAVPAAVPGIVFLSGGQSEAEATAHLNAMNSLGRELPWRLSFSYGRALQASALEAWRGQSGNVATAQAAFRHRARLNGAATNGSYDPKMESEKAA